MNASSITVSLAQAPTFKGIQENLAMHLKFISKSAKHNADIVVFPELSLTGYELDLAEKLALQENAVEISELSKSAVTNGIVVIVGCPLAKSDGKPNIGAVICFPTGDVEFYAKQYLHGDESVFYSAGNQNYSFTVKGFKIGLAICADFANPQHSADMASLNTDVYIASALISNSGYEADAQILSNIASTYKLPVLLSNHITETGGWSTCGKSGVWGANGRIIAMAKNIERGLVICEISHNSVIGSIKT